MKVKGQPVRTQAEQQRLYDRFHRIMDVASVEEFTWRMDGMIHWWLFQMLESCDRNPAVLMSVLTDALNDVGIQTGTVMLKPEDSETVQ